MEMEVDMDVEIAVSVKNSVWDNVRELTKAAQVKGSEPLQWAIQLSASLNSGGVCLPSEELANVLVSFICWENNVPIMWKFLEKALVLRIVPPMLVLALLSVRVIPNRQSQPTAYRLYLELLKHHIFSLRTHIMGPQYKKVMTSIDSVLHLSEVFGLENNEPGLIVVGFIFSVVWQLVEASLDDQGLLEVSMYYKSKWPIKPHGLEIESQDSNDAKKTEHFERLKNVNTTLAIEIIGKLLQDRVTSRILHLTKKNLRAHWFGLIQRLQQLGKSSYVSKNPKILTCEMLQQLMSDAQMILSQGKTRFLHTSNLVMASGSLTSSLCHGTKNSALWLPLDLVLEDAMDGYHVDSTSAIEKISGLIKALQAINGTTWQDTFLSLWIGALRLCQRERDPIEGPMPRLDTRLCLLLCITILVVANLIEEEENDLAKDTEYTTTISLKEKKTQGTRRNELISSLQILGDYKGLLNPPRSVISAANQAVAKSMLFVSGINVGTSYFECVSMKEMPVNCSGNMRHLIVEACIARNLLDTSAYFWPGYVNGCINQMPQSMPSQVPGWSSFVKGAPLNPVMINALISTPASCLAEVEKIFDIAVNGSNEEKISAATILCGASLIRGWNVQEHTVTFITRLLSPIPAEKAGSESHLTDYAPVLNVLIVGIASVDCVQIFSLHGLVPHLACSLMPICEVFGSCSPDLSWTLPTGEEISSHAVFSNAFTLLLKLWRFNFPPLDHGVGDVPTVGSQLTPEYLLLVRNSHLVSSRNPDRDRNKTRLSAVASSSSPQPVFVDSFPKLKGWYRQHQACIASTPSGLVHGSPVHQVVDGLLSMMLKRIHGGNQSLTSGSGSSSGPENETSLSRPKLPAWDIMEAVPFVVDAALTACAHGKLSPRELATGLKDLADFLPATLATIVSYFSAEVTRGVWKPAFMNGTDWPSPAANLSNVEEQIKKILAATGVDVPSLAPVSTEGSSPATIPLPLAAFVSLTITYKIDRASEPFLNLAGPALETLAAGCPWPCMPIVASLWTQKAKRWSDFLVFSASRTVFLHNTDAVVQLVKSCFTATLGLNATHISNYGGVGALLGHGFGSHICGGISPVAPGILFLRVHRSIRNIVFLGEEILSILLHFVREIASDGSPRDRQETMKTTHGKNYAQMSLAQEMIKVKHAASLGASLVWLSGGLFLVQSLIKETLPSWFISVHRSEEEEGSPRMAAMLKGYALSYFAILCGLFAWGIDSLSSASKRRPKILGIHLEFLASALDGKISLGCDWAMWQSYVTGFVSLMVGCAPNWVRDIDVVVLKRLSKGLRQWNEEELAIALLGIGGVGTMGAAAEIILESKT